MGPQVPMKIFSVLGPRIWVVTLKGEGFWFPVKVSIVSEFSNGICSNVEHLRNFLSIDSKRANFYSDETARRHRHTPQMVLYSKGTSENGWKSEVLGG